MDVCYNKKGDNMGRISKTIHMVKEQNPDKSKVGIFFNMAYNMTRYQLNFVDYRKSNFINLSKEDKKKIIGMPEYRKVIKYLNNDNYTSIFLDKILFNKVFADYIGREYLDLRKSSLDDFQKFIKGKKTFFVKKHNSFGGDGVEKITNKNLDVAKLYKKLLKNKQYLVEETIVEHPLVHQINDAAVNNIRIVTLLKDGKVHIICKCLRVSDGQEEVVSCHDIMTSLDNKGKVISKTFDDDFHEYKEHPTTHFVFKEAQVPYMEEILEMAKKAALEVPEVRWVGWDFAVTEKGPIIIEGNFFPSYGLDQFYLINKDYFVKEKIQKILKEEYKNI